MSKERRETLDGAVQKYYYCCPRCESTSTEYVTSEEVNLANLIQFKIYKWVCQECCHVFELMNPDDVRSVTGWVD